LESDEAGRDGEGEAVGVLEKRGGDAPCPKAGAMEGVERAPAFSPDLLPAVPATRRRRPALRLRYLAKKDLDEQ